MMPIKYESAELNDGEALRQQRRFGPTVEVARQHF
jgi:hypothetical protein